MSAETNPQESSRDLLHEFLTEELGAQEDPRIPTRVYRSGDHGIIVFHNPTSPEEVDFEFVTFGEPLTPHKPSPFTENLGRIRQIPFISVHTVQTTEVDWSQEEGV